MNILIPTIGTRGDVQPYIALAVGLIELGHEVTIATHPIQRALVESYDVPFAPIGPDIDLGYETAMIHENAWHWMIGFWRVMKFSFSMLEQAYDDILSLSQHTDLMIVSHTGAGSIEADKLGLPAVSVTLFPQAIPVDDPDQSIFLRAIGKLAGVGMGLMMEQPLNKIRKQVGVKPMGPEGITSPILNLIPVSAHVSPPDPRWERRHRVTGYWFARRPQEWHVPCALESFIESGQPPIVISLGAMAASGEDANEAAQITVEAIRRADVRAVIQGWREPLNHIEMPETIFRAGSVPHDWLLPKAAAVVHHGGGWRDRSRVTRRTPFLSHPAHHRSVYVGPKNQRTWGGTAPDPAQKTLCPETCRSIETTGE
jgi:sterol 3beta-glucosyltransferase